MQRNKIHGLECTKKKIPNSNVCISTFFLSLSMKEKKNSHWSASVG